MVIKNGNEEKYPGSVIGIVPLLLIVLLTVPLYFGGFGSAIVFDPHGLLPTLNLLFLFVCPIITGYLASKSYLRDGSTGLLMLTGGVFAFAIGGLIAGFLLPAKGPNAVITIHNIAVFLAGIFHFIGAGFAFGSFQSEQTVRKRKLQLTQIILGITVFLTILTYCVLHNILPIFFIQGQGPTLIRQLVLGSATLFFCLSGVLFLNSYGKSRNRFLYWYSISLFLISTGLLLIFFQKSFGSPIGWLGRTAQYIGGIYLIIAIFSGAKESGVGVMGFDKILGSFFRNQLEILLKERTEQLSQVNEKLHMEVEKLKQAEEALRESEVYFKSVMDSLPIGVAVNSIDPAVTFKYMNDNFCKYYRTTREALASPDAFWNSVYEDPKRMYWEDVPITRKGEETSFITAQNTPIPGKQLMISTVWDVTKRNKTELRLKENEARFRELFENMYAGVAIYRVENDGEDFIFVDMNRSGERISAVNKEAIIDQSVIKIFPAIKEMGLFDVFKRVYRTGKTEHFPISQYKDNRLSIWVDNTVFKVPSGEIVAVYRDDTERQKAIEKLKQSESEIRELNQDLERRVSQRTAQLERTMRSLESSNKELESFAYIASHDLQEPLRKVQAFSDRLKTKYAAVLDEHGMDYLTRLESSGHRMQTMVNDLLAFSRVKTQGRAFVTIHLNDIVKEVMNDLEIRIKETGASVEINDLPIIEADPHQMQQLFLNLISNALKFHFKDAVPLVKIYQNSDIAAAHDPDVFCKIIVEDNGIGFEDQYRDRIFKPFQRLHGRDEYKGTGIGLAICHRIIERHRGSITADSQVGHGTKFIINLPIKQNSEE